MISGHKYDKDGNLIPPVRYDIHNYKTETLVGSAKTKHGAYRSVERNDMKYGGYAHRATPVYEPKDT